MSDSLKWKIYYPDKTFSNLDGKPEDAPSIGVIVIKQFSAEKQWELLAFGDFYIWTGEEWWKADESGFWQYMFTSGSKIVKFGTNMKDFDFNRMMAEAREDTSDGMGRIT